MLDVERLIAPRCRRIDASGIRRVFELAATRVNPVNLSIGQPDFDVPEPVKSALIDAVRAGRNGYTVTQGVPELRLAIRKRLEHEFGRTIDPATTDTLITSGTCGGLVLTYLALLGPGDECIIPDPYFVVYPQAARMAEATPVLCDTYPDFRMTAERIEPLITERTKFVLINSPGNPTGVTLSDAEVRDIVDLCEARGVLLVSDEIYDEFTYPDGCDDEGRFPSPARYSDQVMLLRGFSKSYAMTGWRLGYATGPAPLIQEMGKLQQYSFVCAPSMVQYAGVVALKTDMSAHVADYERKRDRVVAALEDVTELARPTGAFYAFPKIPDRLGLTGRDFVERAIERDLLIIPGGEFSARDTHFRLSYATSDDQLDRGLDLLVDLLSG